MNERKGNPPIPQNVLKRLEEALADEEKGAEAALMTQAYHLFDGLSDYQPCPQRLDDLEERGELYVVKRSRIVEQIGGETITLRYIRTFVINTNGDEALDVHSQQLCYEKNDGEFLTVFKLPCEIPEIEVSDEDLEEIDGFMRGHIISTLGE
jgi:hypothetical protein